MTEVQTNGMHNDSLLKTQDLIGRPVISLQGEEVGSVARVIVDPMAESVAGLAIVVKGWFKGDKGLEFESVNSFGDYAVTVKNADQVVPLDTLPVLLKLSKDYNMYNMRIITPEGRLIGTIDDFYFNTKTGRIERYILTGGIIKNLFKGRASIPSNSIETIGRDVIIASGSVEEALQKEEGGLQDSLGQWKDNLGQWKDDLGHWKDDFEKAWEKTRARATELTKSVGENIIGAAQVGSGKGKELLTKTEEILTEKRSQLKTSYEYWADRLQAFKSGPGKPLSEDDAAQLVGLKAGKEVTDSEGQVIVAENETVSENTVEKAQEAGKVKELLISVATKDLEDKIEAVENESQKE